MVFFERLTDLLQIIHEDVFMRNLSQSLHGDVGQWFRHLEANSIGSWTDFHDAFLKYWGENKSFDQYLTDLYVLRREDDEIVVQFNRRFHSVYINIPIKIQPSEVVSMVQCTVAQHPDIFLYLRERKSPSLQRMFVDAEEVESNLQACTQLSSQILDDVLDAEESEEGYGKQESNLRHHFQILIHLQILKLLNHIFVLLMIHQDFSMTYG
jgi:hypothetical protein